jgi:hypothetical protein
MRKSSGQALVYNTVVSSHQVPQRPGDEIKSGSGTRKGEWVIRYRLASSPSPEWTFPKSHAACHVFEQPRRG